MNDEDKARFEANVKWFNQFFDDVKRLFESIVESLPVDFLPNDFALSSSHFYYPRRNYGPSIPPYYVLMLGGKHHALQVMAVFDQTLISDQGPFVCEPSIVVVLHSLPRKYGWIRDYAENVIRNRRIEITENVDGKIEGQLHVKAPAQFFAFQVAFERFSADEDAQDAIREHILEPLVDYLEKI